MKLYWSDLPSPPKTHAAPTYLQWQVACIYQQFHGTEAAIVLLMPAGNDGAAAPRQACRCTGADVTRCQDTENAGFRALNTPDARRANFTVARPAAEPDATGMLFHHQWKAHLEHTQARVRLL